MLLIINSPRRKSGWIPKVREIKARVGEKKLIGKKTKVDWKPLYSKVSNFGPCTLIGDLILFSRSKQKFSEHRALAIT